MIFEVERLYCYLPLPRVDLVIAGAFANRLRLVVTVTPASIGSFFVGCCLRLTGGVLLLGT